MSTGFFKEQFLLLFFYIKEGNVHHFVAINGFKTCHDIAIPVVAIVVACIIGVAVAIVAEFLRFTYRAIAVSVVHFETGVRRY